MGTSVSPCSQEKARDLIIKLLAACKKECGITADVIAGAVGEPIGMLDDLAIDTPMAPKLLGRGLHSVTFQLILSHF
jgi:translation initiation factor 4G